VLCTWPIVLCYQWALVAQSVLRLSTSWRVRGSNPGGSRISSPVERVHGVQTVPYRTSTASFLGVTLSGRGCKDQTHLVAEVKERVM